MFAKVFEQILDSSIADDWMVRHVFEDFLKLADKHGIVDMTPGAIARRTGVPLDVVMRGIDKLSGPDPESRSSEAQGRRLILIDAHRSWGWQIVNYVHYRNIRDEEGRREYFREQKRSYRSKSKDGSSPTQVEDMSENVQDNEGQSETVADSPTMSTQAEAEAEADSNTPLARATPDKLVKLAKTVGDSLENLAHPFEADPLDTIPPDAEPMQCAALVMERADILNVPHLLRKFGEAIKLLGKVEHIGIPDATRTMLKRVKAAQADGECKWDHWLVDSGWKASAAVRDPRATVGYEPPNADQELARRVDERYGIIGKNTPAQQVALAKTAGMFAESRVSPEQVLKILLDGEEVRLRIRAAQGRASPMAAH